MQRTMRVTATALVAALAIVAGIGPATGDSTSPPSKLIQELDALGEKLNRALVEGRYEDMLAYYAEDAVVMPNGGAKQVGKKALQAGIEINRTRGVVFETFSTRAEKAWECEGLVYVVGTYAFSASDPGTPRPVADRGKFFSVWRRDTSGHLKVLYDIWNTDIEPGK